LPGGPQDCNKDDELGVRPLHNRAQRPCSHESIVQGCPVWTANNCRRHGYDTRSPKQDSIAAETFLKTSTGKKDEEEATGFTVTNNALSNRRIECVAGVNVDSTSQHFFITSGATLSQPEDSSRSPLRNSPSASMHRSPLSLIARLTKRATRLVSNGDCDVYLQAHTLSHIFTIAHRPRTREQLPRYTAFSTPLRLLSDCARSHRLKQTRWRSRRT
jgi:hypothetical protein